MDQVSPQRLVVTTDGSRNGGYGGYGVCVDAADFCFGPATGDPEFFAVSAALSRYEGQPLLLVTDSAEVHLRLGLHTVPRSRHGHHSQVTAVMAAAREADLLVPGVLSPYEQTHPAQSVAHLLAFLGREMPDTPLQRARELVVRVFAAEHPHDEAKQIVHGLLGFLPCR